MSLPGPSGRDKLGKQFHVTILLNKQIVTHVYFTLMSSINNRILAKEFAKSVMKSLVPPEADAPYLEAVLVEAVLFEEPMKQLEIGLNQVGSFYNITIKGYENLIDIVRWANTFLGLNRNAMLCHVTHSYVQTTDTKVIMVIQMNKIEFHTSKNAELVSDPPTPHRVVGGGTNGGTSSNGIPKKFTKRTQ